MNKRRYYISFTSICLLQISWSLQTENGIFEGNTDIGQVKYPGTVQFGASDSTYAISGSGTHMWFNNDGFTHHYHYGKWLVHISYDPMVSSELHPPNQDVMVRLMDLETKEIKVIANLFGGQGTINVPSWSPDST